MGILQHIEAGEGSEDGGFVFQPDTSTAEIPFVAADVPVPAQLLPSAELPSFAQQVLDALLPLWSDVGMSGKRMRHSAVPEEQLQVRSHSDLLGEMRARAWLPKQCRSAYTSHAHDICRGLSRQTPYSNCLLSSRRYLLSDKACAAVQELLQAAERFQAVLDLQTPPCGAPTEDSDDALAALRKEWGKSTNSPSPTKVKAEANGNARSSQLGSDALLAAADMAAGWSRAASVESPSQHMGSFALAGLAASVLVCGCPRCSACCTGWGLYSAALECSTDVCVAV